MPFDFPPPPLPLDDPQIASVLGRLHTQAKKDFLVYFRALPDAIIGKLSGRTLLEAVEPHLARAYLPVSEEMGRTLYQLARSANAQHIVEFGSSFGVSSIYLALAAKMSGGIFTGTEKDSAKCREALRNLAEAGLSKCSDIREGDALESLAPLDGPVDFLFLDGWKPLYVPILKLLEPKLAPGAIVFADNIWTFRKTLMPFVDYISDPGNGYETTILPFKSGASFSIWNGPAPT